MKKLVIILIAIYAFVFTHAIAENYDLTMGPYQVQFDTVRSLYTRVEPPVDFNDFTGYPVTLWPKNESEHGMISLKIQEYNDLIDVSEGALRDFIKEEASYFFSEHPIIYQTKNIDGRPGVVGTIETDKGETVIFAAYSPDGTEIGGKILALICVLPFSNNSIEDGEVFLSTLKIRRVK